MEAAVSKNFDPDPAKVFIERTELIRQLNSAPLITDETIKGPSERPLNPTPTVVNFSTEISQKYNTTSKEVIIIIKKALKVGMPLHCIISKNMSFNWVAFCMMFTTLKYGYLYFICHT